MVMALMAEMIVDAGDGQGELAEELADDAAMNAHGHEAPS